MAVHTPLWRVCELRKRILRSLLGCGKKIHPWHDIVPKSTCKGRILCDRANDKQEDLEAERRLGSLGASRNLSRNFLGTEGNEENPCRCPLAPQSSFVIPSFASFLRIVSCSLVCDARCLHEMVHIDLLNPPSARITIQPCKAQ